MITLKRILVPTDLSEQSLAALEYALSFSVLYDARLFLLHVADAIPPVVPVQGRDHETDPFRRRGEQEALRALRLFMERRIGEDSRLMPVVRLGVPADEIKRFAEEERVDLVVMTTHGRTGLHHIVMGSVAERVVRLSSVPVLTVKPSQVRESLIRNEDIESELHLR